MNTDSFLGKQIPSRHLNHLDACLHGLRSCSEFHPCLSVSICGSKMPHAAPVRLSTSCSTSSTTCPVSACSNKGPLPDRCRSSCCSAMTAQRTFDRTFQ